jgi:hypothetical protein
LPPEWLDLIKDWEWLLGIIVGSLLSGGISLIAGKINRERIKTAIRDELRANKYQIAQKRDILRQMRESLEDGNIFPGLSAPISTTVFDSHFSSVVNSFNTLERDNLHIIYGRLKIYHRFMNEYEDRLKSDMGNEKVVNAPATYLRHLDSIDKGYVLTSALIDKFLARKPEDVFQQRMTAPPIKYNH